jgi:hypothetical protein
VQRIQGPYKYAIWDEPDEPEFSDDEEGWAAFDREMRDWEMNRPIQLPDIPESGYPRGLYQRNHVVSLKGRKLQVIVQVSDTQLVSRFLACVLVSVFIVSKATRISRISRHCMAC